MLRRDVVHGRGGVLQIAHEDELRVPDREVDDLASRGVLELLLDRGVHLLGERRVRRDEEGPRLGVVLGLREQVERRQAWIDVALGHDRELRRTGETVDADETGDLPFRLGDVDVAGADDAVDRRDRLGPVRHRRDRLGAAALRDVGHTRASRGIQHGRVHRPVALRRRADDDLVDARDRRRDDGHRDGGWVLRPPAGDVAAHRRERPDDLAEADAVGLVPPVPGELTVAQCPQPVDQVVDRPTEVRRRVAFGPSELALRAADAAARQVGAVELLRELDEDLVSLDEDALEDLADRLRGRGIDLELRGLEPPAPLAQVEELEHHSSSVTSCCAASVATSAAFASRWSRIHSTHPLAPTASAAAAKRISANRNVASRSMGWPGYRTRATPDRCGPQPWTVYRACGADGSSTSPRT